MALFEYNYQTLDDYRGEGVTVIDGVTSDETEPAVTIPTGESTSLVCYIEYAGTITTATLTLEHYFNGAWFESDSQALDGATPVIHTFTVPKHTDVGLYVDNITGSGATITVTVVGRTS